ncbi:DUF3999 domain-containing protein [Pseudomonas schmalbachii]|uniref:DUF3999 domain-containing protein n=1 Tax=Pseudomonas schmalbachii TaxID=2816993 RepID=A0ABS3TXU8_9PSED|nr:DUF3999 domain-containing protein [Pseudomonas schmalbachii]MBO3278008.1 DUF3999 domain-containing protein [Pseudomonas schmalbachii]
MKSTVFIKACAALFCAGFLNAGAAAENPADFASQVPLAVSGTGPWYRLQLPIEVQLAARHADLRDLRVFNAEDEALPYSLRAGTARQSETRLEATARVFPLRGAAGSTALEGLRVVRNTAGTIVEIPPAAVPDGARQILRGWLLDASTSDFPLDRLSLEWSAEAEGFQRFRIEASDDLNRWSPLGEGQVARLSFNGERIDNNDVELPGVHARYLRLLWLAPEEAAMLKGARLSGIRSNTEPAPLVWSAPLAGRSGVEGEFIWNLPQALPLERLRIPLEQPETLAPVSLQGRLDGKVQWSPLARTVLYRLSQDGREMRQDEIALPGWPVSQLRLLVDSRGGGLGGPVPQLSVALRASEVIFLARGSAPYRVAVGNASSQSSSLPMTTLVPGYDESSLATMGRAQVEGVLQEGMASRVGDAGDGTNWKRIALWGVLLLGVALLAGMALSLLRNSATKR